MEELLRILEKNARMPIEDIAAMLDKTPEEVAAMMDEAAAKGYIRGYETLVDWEQAGVNLVEAVIELRVTPHKARGFDDIGMTIAQFDEVDTVLLMSSSRLRMPASRTLQGVLKSGSPTPREMQWGISAARSKNLRMPEGRMDFAAGASSSS